MYSLILLFIEFVTIGDVGNVASSNGSGTVDYVYEISKYEISNSQYCVFLNNVACDSDVYNLYSPIMGQHFLGGILRHETPNGFRYEVKEGYNDIPAGGITWNSAIRYINWLHYNSANIEAGADYADFLPLTEGNDSVGAYNTQLKDFKRNTDAIYWMPNEDEWNKACFYDGHAWNEEYSDSSINCFNNTTGWKYSFPHIKPNHDIVHHTSYYVTVNQLGNLAEWVENLMGTDWHKALGGSLIRSEQQSRYNQYEGDYPDKSIISFGVRICRIPNLDHRLNAIVTSIDINNSHIDNNLDRIHLHIIDDNHGTYVLVDHENNEGDYANQYKGYVGYKYYISKYELTNAEYCHFLNSVASKADPYNLYNTNMSESVCGGIDRIKTRNGYNYVSKPGWGNRPIVYIGFYELARYANWLHFGCPTTGESTLETTEGTSTLGAYDTSDFEQVRTGQKTAYKKFGQRNNGALYWIPNENEWYKAAYYDPTIIGNRKYHDYPTRSSTPPTAEQANYLIDGHLTEGAPFYISEVDKYSNAQSYFGTQQQGGNVWEWIESWQYGKIGTRGLKGGSWSYTEYGLNAINTDPGGINDINYVFGGRLCKSYNTDGWNPKSESNTTKLKHYINLLSEKKLLVMIGGFALVIITLLILLMLSIHRRKQNGNN